MRSTSPLYAPWLRLLGSRGNGDQRRRSADRIASGASTKAAQSHGAVDIILADERHDDGLVHNHEWAVTAK